MERVSPLSPQRQAEQVASLAPVEPAALTPALDQLAFTARNVPGEEGREAHRRLHEALATLQPLEANGALLVRLLDEHAFDDLRDDQGTSTREVAVETLLRLGYPWALHLHPDELAWLRDTQVAAKRMKYLILLSILSIGGIAAGFLAWYF